MSYAILQPRAPGEPPDPLYPDVGADGNSYLTEPGDGKPIVIAVHGAIASLTAKGGATTQTARVHDIKATVVITESRVVFVCKQFRTGTQLRGYGVLGSVVALSVNAASKAGANHKVRDYTLVGQVRYDWLVGAAAQDHAWGTPNSLTLVFRDPTGGSYVGSLVLGVERRNPAVAAARQVVRRAALWQAASAPDAQRTALLAWSESVASSRPTNGARHEWELPTAEEKLAGAVPAVDIAPPAAALTPPPPPSAGPLLPPPPPPVAGAPASTAFVPSLPPPPAADPMAQVAFAPPPPPPPDPMAQMAFAPPPPPPSAAADGPGPLVPPSQPPPVTTDGSARLAPPPPPAVAAPLDDDPDATRLSVPRASAAWSVLLADGRRLALDAPLILGRNPVGSAAYADATLVPVGDPTSSVSKTHAAIVLRDGCPTVTDLRSTNGTTVIEEGGRTTSLIPGTPHPITEASRMFLGDYAVDLVPAP